MPRVSAAGKAYKPVMVFPAVNPLYRKIKGVLQSLHAVLPDFYLHYREIPGADSAIVHDCAKHFVEETRSLRENGQYLLLILDGYSTHIQFATLNHFRLNRIICIALCAHSSHRLQPLDVSMFNSYKSFLQSFLHSSAMVRNVLNAFDLGSLISNVYDKSMTASNISSEFEKCRIWDGNIMGTNVQVLDHLFEESGKHEEKPTMEGLIRVSLKKGRSLLRDANVEEEGTIRINMFKGAHLTSDAIIDALKRREAKKLALAKKKAVSRDKSLEDIRKPPKALRHYAQLADGRFKMRKKLRESRRNRRDRQKRLVSYR